MIRENLKRRGSLAAQGNLFKKPCETDRVGDFLKSLFASIERTWSFDVIEESYEEYSIQ